VDVEGGGEVGDVVGGENDGRLVAGSCQCTQEDLVDRHRGDVVGELRAQAIEVEMGVMFGGAGEDLAGTQPPAHPVAAVGVAGGEQSAQFVAQDRMRWVLGIFGDGLPVEAVGEHAVPVAEDDLRPLRGAHQCVEFLGGPGGRGHRV